MMRAAWQTVSQFLRRVSNLAWFRPVVAVAVVAVVICVFAAPTLFDGRTLFNIHSEFPPSDETSVHLPLHAEVNRRMAQGDLPLFDPYPAFGQPLAADSNALVFDPFLALFRGAGTITGVMSARTILMAAAGALAVFGFLGLFGVSTTGSAVGAAVYCSLVLRYPGAEEQLFHYAVTDWAVISLYMLALAIRKGRAWAFPAAGVATGFSALAGHPQAVYFSMGLCALYVAGEAIARRRTGWKPVVFGGAGWLATGLLIGSAQLIPLVINVFSSAHFFSNPLHPEFDEDLVGYALTLAGPGLLVIVVTVFRRRWLEIAVLASTILFFLTIADTPIVYVWHHVLPFFDNFKLSSKYFISPFPILAAIGIGLGIGAAGAIQGLRGRVAVTACVICGLWSVYTAPFDIIYQLQQTSARVETLDPACVADIKSAMPPYGRMVRLGTEALYPSLSVAAGIFDVQASSGQISARYSRLMQTLNVEHAEMIVDDSRVRALADPDVLKLPFWDVAGVTTLVSAGPVDIPGWKQVLARPERTCMTDQTGYYIYTNTEVMPRAFLAGRFKAFGSEDTEFDYVVSTAADRLGPVPVSGAFDTGLISPSLTAVPDIGAASIRQYSGDRVVIDVDASQDSVLVVSDAWSDGWVATVDGGPAPLLRAWYLLRAVPVRSGHHEVVMEYRPVTVTAGLACGAAGILIALVWGVTAVFLLPAWRRRIHGRRSEECPASDQ